GRDVAVSVRAASRSWAPDWRRRFGLAFATSIRSWRESVELTAALEERFGDRFLTLRYEDIKRDPLVSFRRLFDFCGFPYDEALLRRVFESTDFAKNFTGGDGEFRRAGVVGDWKRRFS